MCGRVREQELYLAFIKVGEGVSEGEGGWEGEGVWRVRVGWRVRLGNRTSTWHLLR